MQLFVKNVDVLCLGFQQQVILLLSLQGVWMMILGLSQISQFFGTAELSGMRVSNQITDRRAAYFGRFMSLTFMSPLPPKQTAALHLAPHLITSFNSLHSIKKRRSLNMGNERVMSAK